MLHDIKKKTGYLPGTIALTVMFFIVFVFSCIISLTNTTMGMTHSMSSSGHVASSMNNPLDDHMNTVLSLPQSPERGILFIALALLLASISVLMGVLLAHTIHTQLVWHMRKERILLFNPIISQLKAGIIHPKIF